VDDFINFTNKIKDEKIRINDLIDRKCDEFIRFKDSDKYLWTHKNIKDIIFLNVVWYPKNTTGNYNQSFTTSSSSAPDNYTRQKNINDSNAFFKKIDSTHSDETYLDNVENIEKAVIGNENIIYTSRVDNNYRAREYFTKFMKFFTIMQKIFLHTRVDDIKKDIDTIYDDILVANEIIEKIQNIPQKYKSSYKKIASDIKNIYTYYAIDNKYMNEEQMNINIKDEEEFIVEKLKSDFKIFIDYIENIKQILPEQKESTNSTLQQMINDYSIQKVSTSPDKHVNVNNCGFNDVMLYILENFVKKASKHKNLKKKCNFSNDNIERYFYSGLSKINRNNYEKPQFEIHLHLNLIEGEVNNENLQKIACNFKGLYLGKELEHLFVNYNKYDVLEDSIFISLNDKPLNIALDSPSSTKEPPNFPKKQGGKRKIYKNIKRSLNRKSNWKNVVKKYPRNNHRFTKKKNSRISYK
jgi:hypothetical protein